MKRILQSCLAWALFLGAIQTQPVQAQQFKPIVVVSINSLQELIADGKFVEGLANAGQPNEVWQMVPQFTQGIDNTKPFGGVFGVTGTEMKGMGFIPVTDFDAITAQAAQLAGGGEVEDGPNGTKLIGPAAAKEQNGYAYVAQSPDHLQELPDPAKILGGLTSKYDIAVTINLQNVPALYRQLGIGLMRQGLEDQLEKSEEETEDQFQLRKEMAQQQVKMIEQMMDQVDTVTLGLSIDRSSKNMFLDYVVTAKPGSEIATQFAQMRETNTRFGTLIVPEAPFSMHLASKITDTATLERAIAQLTAFRTAINSQIENSEDIESDEERAIFKELAAEGMDLLTSLYKDGVFDFAVVATKNGNSPFQLLAGLHFTKGKALESYVKKLLTMAMEAEEKFPPVKFNAAQHAGANIHSLKLPVPEDAEEAENVKKMFGPDPGVNLAFSENAAWLAFGNDTMDALKNVIESSSQGEGKLVKPVEMSVSLIPFMKLSAETDDNPVAANLANMMESGKDRVRLWGNAIENGASYRFQLDEGVLKLISFGISQAQDSFGGGEEEPLPAEETF